MNPQQEFIALMSRLQQDRFIHLCMHCTFELDTRFPHYEIDGFYSHVQCPVITPKYT